MMVNLKEILNLNITLRVKNILSAIILRKEINLVFSDLYVLHSRNLLDMSSTDTQNTSACFVKAAKAEVLDDFQGTIDTLAWGNVPRIGIGGHFDIVYSMKVFCLVFSVVTRLRIAS
ncbi:uncharacterized protein LOC120127307 isoform X2 [Hibiscus syriacus]|uniref:uncharacterized protein LOC120127307 isoform X2 n=1 Tax=Hibiscus syriacus TaxID=106335 RepID=UPI0019227B17|nr:uncharacterized protein LOC120127307 isoform X2 [Hibiscus syriacus]